MGYDLGIYETRTGAVVDFLPHTALSFNTPLDDSGKAEATIPLCVPELEGLDLRAVTTPWRFSLLIASGDTVHWFGPITPGRTYNGDGTITLPASELWAIFAARPLLGNYDTVGVNGEPATDLTLTAATLSGLAVRIAERAQVLPGGSLPLALPDYEPGDDHTRTYEGSQLTPAAEALKNLTEVENGPDIRFDAEFVDNRTHARWVMKVG